MSFKIVSVNVGLPRTVEFLGQQVTTGIFKSPVSGRIPLRRLNLDGDRQADLKVHGGPDKAVYAYPAAHYDFWRAQLPGVPLPWGSFGENLTIEGYDEESVFIGDRFQAGSAELVVSQPRMPCYKLGVRFGDAQMVKRFLASRRTGFYFRVLREGEIAAGDEIMRLARDPGGVSVADITRLYVKENRTRGLLERAVAVEALASGWRDYFRERLETTVS